MNRRQFLIGSVASVGATTALVQLATEAETLQLVPKARVMIGHPMQALPDSGWEPEMYMRRRDGKFVAVGVLTMFEAKCEDDVLQWNGKANITPVSGTIYFEGALAD